MLRRIPPPLLLAAGLLGLLLLAGNAYADSPEPTPTVEPAGPATPSPEPTAAGTPDAALTPTDTPAPDATATPDAAPAASPTPDATPTTTPGPPRVTRFGREGVDYAAGQVLVRFTPGTSAAAQRAVAANRVAASAHAEPPAHGITRVIIPPNVSVEEAVDRLKRDPSVRDVVPNYRYELERVPADPCYAGASGCTTGQRWYYDLMGAPKAWDVTTGSASVVVAVIDTGVQTAHPDLGPALWQNPGDSNSNGLDDDANGCIDDRYGCNFVDDPPPTTGCTGHAAPNGQVDDDDGHGTFVAGEIGAAWDNGNGVAGLAPGARIMTVKVLDCNGSGWLFDVASGIYYAADMGARVISMSLGGTASNSVMQDAVDYATSRGVLVVAAAGNDNSNVVRYPAAYPNVVAVGASGGPGSTDQRASFSNWGPEIDVAAPGVNLCSTVPTWQVPSGYQCGWAGTSMSTPLVSGLAALILSNDPSQTPEEVVARIKGSATSLPDGSTPNWDGAGRMNAWPAVFSASYRIAAGGLAR